MGRRRGETGRRTIYSRHTPVLDVIVALTWKEAKRKNEWIIEKKMYAIRNDRVMFVDVSYLCLENRHSDIRGSESLVELKKKTYANRRIAGKSRKWNRRRYIRRDPRVYRYRKSRLCLSAMDRVCILTRERERERERGQWPIVLGSRRVSFKAKWFHGARSRQRW